MCGGYTLSASLGQFVNISDRQIQDKNKNLQEKKTFQTAIYVGKKYIHSNQVTHKLVSLSFMLQ